MCKHAVNNSDLEGTLICLFSSLTAAGQVSLMPHEIDYRRFSSTLKRPRADWCLSAATRRRFRVAETGATNAHRTVATILPFRASNTAWAVLMLMLAVGSGSGGILLGCSSLYQALGRL